MRSQLTVESALSLAPGDRMDSLVVGSSFSTWGAGDWFKIGLLFLVTSASGSSIAGLLLAKYVGSRFDEKLAILQNTFAQGLSLYSARIGKLTQIQFDVASNLWKQITEVQDLSAFMVARVHDGGRPDYDKALERQKHNVLELQSAATQARPFLPKTLIERVDEYAKASRVQMDTIWLAEETEQGFGLQPPQRKEYLEERERLHHGLAAIADTICDEFRALTGTPNV
jgi:hypothetical protein